MEKILNLTHPNQETAAETDKRTWRDGSVRPERKVDTTWTATDVLVAYANAKGWLTAKAGRPDIHRAGNASKSWDQFTSLLILNWPTTFHQCSGTRRSPFTLAVFH